MAKITDPDDIDVGTELTLDTAASTFTLNVAGSLVAKDGVTLQALYSKFVDLWTTASYNKFEFPMYAIDALSGQFQFGTDGQTFSGWKPADDATRQMLRDGGWSEYSNAGVLNRQYTGIVSLGNVSAGAQLYFQRDAADAATDFTFDDEVNEGIQVYGDASNGNFDKRTFFKGFVREYGQKYKDSVLADTGKTATGAYIVNMLLSNEDDLDITADDTDVSTLSPYTEINVKYFDGAYTKDVDSTTDRNFGIVIDVGTHSGIDGSCSSGGSTFTSADGGIDLTDYDGGTLTIHEGSNAGIYPINGTNATTVTLTTGTFANTVSNQSFTLQRATPVVATLQQIYTKVQYLLRQDANINTAAGTVNGKTASLLLNFVGPQLICGFYAPTNAQGGGSGVMVEGIRDADLNSITFYDNTATAREYPFASAGLLNFNAVLTAGGTSYYRMYFLDLSGSNDYGLTGAVTVNDADGNPIQGTITGSSISFTFDYDGNTQGGRTPGTDADVVIVAGNAGSAKPVVATGTITESKAISISLVAEQDRAYLA
jgi:hypothetical protein